MFHGKPHYFYGQFQWQTLTLTEGIFIYRDVARRSFKFLKFCPLYKIKFNPLEECPSYAPPKKSFCRDQRHMANWTRDLDGTKHSQPLGIARANHITAAMESTIPRRNTQCLSMRCTESRGHTGQSSLCSLF